MAADPPLVAVLAAGAGKRFGGGKLDAICAGKLLGQWALEAVEGAGLPPGIIVVGEEAPRFALRSPEWERIVNPAAAEGLGTSVAIAARAALAAECDLLLVLADMPLVDPAHLRRLASEATPAATAWPDDSVGVPAFVPAGHLARLSALDGTRGAGPVLRALPGLRRLAAAPGALVDVDTADDLARCDRLLAGRS